MSIRFDQRAAVVLSLLAAALALITTGCADEAAVTGVAPAPVGTASATTLPSTTADFLAIGNGPIAIAHRGMGANLSEDATRPVENTLAAVRQGFETGAAVVEVDLQMTADNEIIAWHDDFLADGTCIGSLTRAQLAERMPDIVSFQAILQTARRYNIANPDRLSGLLTVDLKPSSPLCDPDDAREARFVDNVVRIIRSMGATELIYFNSMSPVLLALAAQQAPEIPRQLTVLFLQMLSPAQVEGALGLPVTLIDKAPEYGLQWAEVGAIHRLPGYTSPQQAIATAFATGSQLISWDLLLLGHIEQTMSGAAAQLVQGTQALGLHVVAGDVWTASDWMFGASLGVHALYANDVPLAVSLQGALH
ncbi:MAG TPA: glycerophosphodiester phosphodiesterase [Longimicrobiales bacterium]